jgi:hypothetical protein
MILGLTETREGRLAVLGGLAGPTLAVGRGLSQLGADSVGHQHDEEQNADEPGGSARIRMHDRSIGVAALPALPSKVYAVTRLWSDAARLPSFIFEIKRWFPV